MVGIGLIAFSIVAILRPALWGEWINLVLGVWLILAPFLMPHPSSAARWNHLIVGILVVADALLAVWMQPAQQPRHWFLSGRRRGRRRAGAMLMPRAGYRAARASAGLGSGA